MVLFLDSCEKDEQDLVGGILQMTLETSNVDSKFWNKIIE